MAHATSNSVSCVTNRGIGGHCEYIYTDRRYGNGGATAAFFRVFRQDITYYNTIDFNAYLNAIEHFDPTNNADDVFRWIPQGLPYDLFDTRNDNFAPIVDQVSNISYSQSFNALQPDVRSITAFKIRLFQQVGNAQLTQINELFQQYGY